MSNGYANGERRKFDDLGATIFCARIPGTKNMKPVKASLHALRHAAKRFMTRSVASYAEGMLHLPFVSAPPFQMEHCCAKAPQYEATPLSLRYEALGIRLV